jgi:hypothetical protein
VPFDRSTRTLAALPVLAGVVGVGTGLALVATGTSPGLAVAFGALAGLFALIVLPLIAIASEVGSKADDHDEIERRVASGLGLSKAEFDDSFEGDGRSGYLYDADDLEERE